MLYVRLGLIRKSNKNEEKFRTLISCEMKWSENYKNIELVYMFYEHKVVKFQLSFSEVIYGLVIKIIIIRRIISIIIEAKNKGC